MASAIAIGSAVLEHSSLITDTVPKIIQPFRKGSIEDLLDYWIQKLDTVEALIDAVEKERLIVYIQTDEWFLIAKDHAAYVGPWSWCISRY